MKGAAALVAGARWSGRLRHGARTMAAPDLLSNSNWLDLLRRDRAALLLDLDGTLIPFADRPEHAVLDPAAAELLGALSAAGVQIVIVTGRPVSLVEPMCAQLPFAWWFAEHGAWQRIGGEWTAPRAEVPDFGALAVSLTDFTALPGTRVEQKSLAIALHWREVITRAARSDDCSGRARVRGVARDARDVRAHRRCGDARGAASRRAQGCRRGARARPAPRDPDHRDR